MNFSASLLQNVKVTHIDSAIATNFFRDPERGRELEWHHGQGQWQETLVYLHRTPDLAEQLMQKHMIRNEARADTGGANDTKELLPITHRGSLSLESAEP